ncbi:MAG: nucleotidyltransferase domain-containing protein [Candidatus Omnitrophica bacterium]|nr:nucleotidyltransferase domain-containing protein [Candidatus Omnitrophota bacterium]
MSVLFGTKLRKKLLTYAFSRVDGEFYVRQAAAVIDEDAGNLSRELKRLEDEGIFISRVSANARFYSINKKYPLFKEVKAIVAKTSGIEGRLKDIVAAYKEIDLAFIYGSYAKNKEKKGSDIDVIFVGTALPGKIAAVINSFESEISREINYTFYKKDEFENKRREKGDFLAEVLDGKIVVLKGDIHER